MFRSILFSAVMLATLGAAQLTADQVVANVKIVTNVSSQINDALGQLTTSSTFNQVQTTSTVCMTILYYMVLIARTLQTVTNGFNTIINDLGADVTAMQATPPFDDADATPIVNALTDVSR
jgi:hypothetical protein